MRFSQQVYWGGLPFPPPVDHALSELSLLWPVHLGWPCATWLIASLSYISPFSTTRQWPMKGKVLVTQSCPTMCKPTDGSPPGSAVHGILQARILEWVAIPFSRGSSQPRNWTQVSCIVIRFFTVWVANMMSPAKNILIMRNVGLDELQARIKIGGRNSNNLRYVDAITLMSESKEELKSLLMTVREESERAGLRLNVKKN